MKKSKEIFDKLREGSLVDGWQNLLSLYEDEIDELEGKLAGLEKEVRHIKQEIERIS